jgi:FADH2 O2-dependent halogenase
MPRLTYRAALAAGPRWAMLPSAAAFVDPLFSTGFPLTLLGIERLAALIESGAFFDDAVRSEGSLDPPSGAQSLEGYSATTLAEADHTARFVAGCYAGFPRFDDFVQYSMFYFAAASYAEMARRVAPERAAAGFLRAGDPVFASAMCSLSPGESGALAGRVREAVDAVNIAGLCDTGKMNWYAADAADAIAGAPKLGVPPRDVAAALAALGF